MNKKNESSFAFIFTLILILFIYSLIKNNLEAAISSASALAGIISLFLQIRDSHSHLASQYNLEILNQIRKCTDYLNKTNEAINLKQKKKGLQSFQSFRNELLTLNSQAKKAPTKTTSNEISKIELTLTTGSKIDIEQKKEQISTDILKLKTYIEENYEPALKKPSKEFKYLAYALLAPTIIFTFILSASILNDWHQATRSTTTIISSAICIYMLSMILGIILNQRWAEKMLLMLLSFIIILLTLLLIIYFNIE